LDKLFKDYNVQENVDILHKVVTDAKERKASGTVGKSVWKDNLDPRVAVAARTVPVLTSEADRLRALTAQVRTLRVFFNSFFDRFQIDAENRQLKLKLDEKVQAIAQANDQVLELLDKVDTVGFIPTLSRLVLNACFFRFTRNGSKFPRRN